MRKNFEKVYAALASSGVNGDSVKHLPGLHERDNLEEAPEVTKIFTGLPEAKVKLLGDGNATGQTRYLGEASQPEERQENRSVRQQDLHRFIKESFNMED